MTVKFAVPKEFLAPKWVTLDLGDGASIELAVKLPTLAEQLEALADTRGESVTAYRLRSRIMDWRGVLDEEGMPVPYSWDNLSALCISFPEAVFDLLIVVRDAVSPTLADNGIGELGDPSKNSETPPAVGGTGTSDGTIVLTPSSDGISGSEGSSDYAR